nr:LOW QUALITY PROTEIN: probable ethanolamine kinase A [Dermatophagoides farinae]
MDMESDREFLKKLINKVDSPLLFSHNDLNRQNRLVKFDDNGQKQIYFIDLDFTNYGWRGLDLGRYFSNYRHHDDMFGNEGFPDDQQMNLFLDEYRCELSKHHSSEWLKDERNSLEHLRDEAKIFTLKAYSVDAGFGVMMFVQNPTSDKFLITTKNRYEGFLQLKKRFTDDGTIARILGDEN